MAMAEMKMRKRQETIEDTIRLIPDHSNEEMIALKKGWRWPWKSSYELQIQKIGWLESISSLASLNLMHEKWVFLFLCSASQPPPSPNQFPVNIVQLPAVSSGCFWGVSSSQSCSMYHKRTVQVPVPVLTGIKVVPISMIASVIWDLGALRYWYSELQDIIFIFYPLPTVLYCKLPDGLCLR